MVCSSPLKEKVTFGTDKHEVFPERKYPNDKKISKEDADFLFLFILNILIVPLPTICLFDPDFETLINILQKTLVSCRVFDTDIESKNRFIINIKEITMFIDVTTSTFSETDIVSNQTLLNRINNIKRLIMIFNLKLLQKERENLNKNIFESMNICSQCDEITLEPDKGMSIFTKRRGYNTLCYREVKAQDDPTDYLISTDVNGYGEREVDPDKVTITKIKELGTQAMLENQPENEIVEETPKEKEKTISRIENDEEHVHLLTPQKGREECSAKDVEQGKQSNMGSMGTKSISSEKLEEDACRKQTVAKTAGEKALTNTAMGEGDGGSSATKTTQQMLSEKLEKSNEYVEAEEDNKQKPGSCFPTEPDDVVSVKACIKEMTEPSKNLLIEKKENSKRKLKNRGLRKISDADVTKEVLSMIHIKNPQNTLAVYMLPSNQRAPPAAVGDIPWAWLKDEKWRLSTFANYPITASKPGRLLAANGFVYIGFGKVGDHITMCFFCRLTKVDWQRRDNISDIHSRLSPNCPMVTIVNGLSAGGSQPSDQRPSAPSTQPSTGTDASLITPTYSESVTSSAPERLPRNGGSQPSDHRPSAPSTQPSTGTDASLITPTYSESDTTSAPERFSRNDDQMQATSTGNSSSRYNTETEHILTSVTTAPREIGNQPISFAGSGVAPSISSHQEPRTNPSANLDGNSIQNDSRSPTSFSASSTGQTATALERNTDSTTTQSITRVDRLSYDDLGIVTERPRRPEYAARQTRFETFVGKWPADHPLTKEDMADAGFYYAGYSDCGRCFYCNGGVRNWEDGDDAWVEHARWFPKCGFVKQTFGMEFINAVHELNRDNERISFEMVAKKMGVPLSHFQLQDGTVENALKEDPAVKTVVCMGYREDDVIEAAQILKDNDVCLSADILFDKLQDDNRPRNLLSSGLNLQRNYEENDASSTSETLRNLKERNNELRQQLTCKICLDKAVSIIFLPCGHLVSCSQCAAAMKNCPLCRVFIKGRVKASLK